jgi:hypothetical protein
MNVKNDAIIDTLFRLPNLIEYCGYIFRLTHCVENNVYWIGYYLTDVTSKSKYKRLAFKMGFWAEHRKIVTSSNGSDYLFKIPIMKQNDNELAFTLSTLFKFFVEHKLLDEKCEHTNHIEISNLTSNLLNNGRMEFAKIERM